MPGVTKRRLAQRCAVLVAAGAAAIGVRPAKGVGRGAWAPPQKWLAFYGQLAEEAAFSGYDLIVLDPMFQGDTVRIGAGGARLCAYLSLGEVRRGDAAFDRLDPACLLNQNPAWPDTWRVDVRHAAWRNFILREKLPSIQARGFTGLMLDTLDTPPWLELLQPAVFAGMRQAAVALVQAIRDACPGILMIVNRGYAILPQLRQSIDAVLAESLLTSPDANGGFCWNPPGDVQAQLALLAPCRDAMPPLPILSLDYWDPADTTGMRAIYRRQRALGHWPYVATSNLGVIVPEPSC